MTVEAVIFDWGGTLTPWHTIEFGGQWRVYLEAVGRRADDETVAALCKAEEDAWRLARDEHRATTLDAILTAAGLDPTDSLHRAGLAAYRAWWEPHTYIDPDAPPLLAALRERSIRVGVLSNTVWTRDHHEEVFARDGVLDLIDGAVYSSELDWTKPHPEAFLAAMAAVDMADASRCVFVGDRLFDDIHGAKAVGMRGVHVPHSAIPDWQRGHTDGEPDATVDRLADLLPIVDGWLAGRTHVAAG